MKKQVKTQLQQGFTLIELIIVIAILSFITMIGIKQYGNLKLLQARKVNVANLKRVANAVEVYDLARQDSESGARTRFDNLDSLIEVPPGTTTTENPDGSYTITTNDTGWANAAMAGQCVWTPGPEDESSIIYDGNWKHASTDAAKIESKKKNQGITSELAGKIGLYYLTATDAALLNENGVSQILLHNWTVSGNVTVNTFTPTGLTSPGGGGPGWRPDMSAYYPVLVTNGTPVIILKPTASSKQTGYLYNHLGFTLSTDSDTLKDESKWTTERGGLLASTKLILFGLGYQSDMVRSAVGLNETPVNPCFDKYYYRNYFLVFAIKNGSTGHQSSCRVVGILDCEGNDLRGAEYNLNWQTSDD